MAIYEYRCLECGKSSGIFLVEGVQQSVASVQSGNIARDILVLLAFIPVFTVPAAKLLAKKFA